MPLQEPRDGSEDRLVLDIFRVDAAEVTGEGEGEPWDRFAEMLEQAVGGSLAVAEEVRRRTRPSSLGAKVLPRVPIQITVDNEASDRFTVLEVEAPDLPGVLHAITSAVSQLGLVIHLSKVASEAGRVVDAFYVSDGDGGAKVVGEQRIEALRAAVGKAIAGLAPDKPEKHPGEE